MQSTLCQLLVAAAEWMLATAVVAIITVLVWQSMDLVQAHQSLQAAAEAAAREAVLPGATRNSVRTAMQRTLAHTALRGAVDQPVIAVNHLPEMLAPLTQLRTGDQVEVSLGIWSTDAAPDILRFLGLSLAERKLIVTATARKP